MTCRQSTLTRLTCKFRAPRHRIHDSSGSAKRAIPVSARRNAHRAHQRTGKDGWDLQTMPKKGVQDPFQGLRSGAFNPRTNPNQVWVARLPKQRFLGTAGGVAVTGYPGPFEMQYPALCVTPAQRPQAFRECWIGIGQIENRIEEMR